MIGLSPNDALPRERFDAWTDFLDHTFMPLRLVPAGEQPLRIEVNARPIHDLSLVNVAGAGCIFERGRFEIARSSEHFYMVSMHLSGEASVVSRGVEKQLACGDIFIIDTMHDVTLGLENNYDHLLVKIPKHLFEAYIPRPDLLWGSSLSQRDPCARLYASYLLAGFQLGDQLPASVTIMFSQHLLELLSEAFTGKQQNQFENTNARYAAIFVRACRLIALHLHDSTLAPEAIAKNMGISTRMLQRIFEAHGETVMRYVFKQRIARASKLLSSVEARKRTITEIAFACGFNDATHFGRKFCETYGSTPSEWRRNFNQDT